MDIYPEAMMVIAFYKYIGFSWIRYDCHFKKMAEAERLELSKVFTPVSL